jgi:hypothetical protein
MDIICVNYCMRAKYEKCSQSRPWVVFPNRLEFDEEGSSVLRPNPN